jgi:hypothetical protein
MAKKKTTKTGAKPVGDVRSKSRQLADEIRALEERQAIRATDRAIGWARLLDQLEGLLNQADELFVFGPPVDHDHVVETHKSMVAEIDDPRDHPTLGDVRKMEVQSETYLLARDLQLAENWLPMIGDEYRTGRSAAIADVRLRLEGEPPHDPFATPAEAIALAITCVRMLLEVDLARAKRLNGTRPPREREIEVLRVLLTAKIALTAPAIGEKLGTRRDPLPDKVTHDAVDRLRHECGFEILRTGAGYKLTDRDRALAREYGISGEVSGAETE